jgi:hypothetical protein
LIYIAKAWDRYGIDGSPYLESHFERLVEGAEDSAEWFRQ